MTEFLDTTNRGFLDSRMRGESEIVVGRQHHDIFAGNADDGAVLGFNLGFAFERLRFLKAIEFLTYGFLKFHGFKITFNASPRASAAKPSSNCSSGSSLD